MCLLAEQAVGFENHTDHRQRFTAGHPVMNLGMPVKRPNSGLLTPCFGYRGYSFVELLVVVTILLILASAILPLGKVTMQRQREIQLSRSLREMRTAIDRFKDAVDLGLIGGATIEASNEGYPPDLETLVTGVETLNDASGRKIRFLRRIPVDPMTKSTGWALRSYKDDRQSQSWGGDNVYDVYTKSTGIALDGTRYRDW